MLARTLKQEVAADDVDPEVAQVAAELANIESRPRS
jgi:hypothetical protein